MKKSDAGQAIGQGQNKQIVKDIYIKRVPGYQVKSYVLSNVNSDDKPFCQTGFCHYLRIKNFDTGSLLPGVKITKKQKRAIESITANCLEMPGENISIGFDQKFFGKGSPPAMSGYGFKPFDAIRHMLEKAGYIETYAPKSYNTDTHPVSWLKGTKKLYNSLSSNAVIEYKPDFAYLLKGKVNETDKHRQYLPIPNPNSPQLRKIRAIMQPYHRQIEQHDISCNIPDSVIHAVQQSHWAMGKAGDPPTPPDTNFKYPIVIFSDNLQSNGRLYNSWWTGCKREYRQYLRIDGEQCVELDFKSMHPNILYGMENMPPQDNIYIYDKSDIFQGNVRTRDVVKVLLLALINIERKRTLKETRSHTVQAAMGEIKSKYGTTLKYQDVSDLLSEIEARHYPVANHFYNEAWRYCTAYESNLIRDIIKAAMSKNILVLSVHDSVICKVSDMQTVKAIIKAKTNLPFESKMFN